MGPAPAAQAGPVASVAARVAAQSRSPVPGPSRSLGHPSRSRFPIAGPRPGRYPVPATPSGPVCGRRPQPRPASR